MEITARDLARLIELNKKKAELEFKKTVYSEDNHSELTIIGSNAAEIASKVGSMEIVYPNQRKLDELGRELEKVPAPEMKQAIKTRSGPAYKILCERGQIVKSNHENRFEIAKLCMLTNSMSIEERKAILDAVRCGAVAGPIKVESLSSEDRMKLSKFMQRCGMMCAIAADELVPKQAENGKEIKLEVSNRSVWVDESVKPRLEENMKKISQLNASIQLKNALRQVNHFNDEEEHSFATLQKEFLDLLKQQDELLKDFNEEEKVVLKVN